MKNRRFEEMEFRGGLFTELRGMIRKNRKFWLVPLLVILVLLAVFSWLASTGAAPFIYTLF